MKLQGGMLLFFFHLLGGLLTRARSACVPLRGIESNLTGTVDRNTTLSLEAVSASLVHEAFDPLNPPVPTLAACSMGLETSVSMRNLLGQYPKAKMCALFHEYPTVVGSSLHRLMIYRK